MTTPSFFGSDAFLVPLRLVLVGLLIYWLRKRSRMRRVSAPVESAVVPSAPYVLPSYQPPTPKYEKLTPELVKELSDKELWFAVSDLIENRLVNEFGDTSADSVEELSDAERAVFLSNIVNGLIGGDGLIGIFETETKKEVSMAIDAFRELGCSELGDILEEAYVLAKWCQSERKSIWDYEEKWMELGNRFYASSEHREIELHIEKYVRDHVDVFLEQYG